MLVCECGQSLLPARPGAKSPKGGAINMAKITGKYAYAMCANAASLVIGALMIENLPLAL